MNLAGMRPTTKWLIGSVLLCAVLFAGGHMLDLDIKWVAIPVGIILLLFAGP